MAFRMRCYLTTLCVFLAPFVTLAFQSAVVIPKYELRSKTKGSTYTRLPVKLSAAGSSENSDYDLVGDRDFWAQQRELASELTDASDKSARADAQEKFAKQRLDLVTDTAFIGFYIFCALWIINANPFVALSYSFGATMGVAYAYGLGKYVETVGGSIDDVDTPGAGVGGARFAFLIILFIIVGKFRAVGLQEVPSIAGFFTYQLASLTQGLKDIND